MPDTRWIAPRRRHLSERALDSSATVRYPLSSGYPDLNFYLNVVDVDKTIFYAIAQSTPKLLDAVVIAAIMKGFVDASEHSVALELFFEYPSLCASDDFCNVCAIKASIGLRDFTGAKRIIRRLRAQHFISDDKPHLNNIVLALFAEIGDVDAPETHFLSIAPRRRGRAMANVLMKAFVEAQRGDDALALYSDDSEFALNKTALISHVMALRACSVSRRFERGR